MEFYIVLPRNKYHLPNNNRMCVYCVWEISEQLNQENGKSYGTCFFRLSAEITLTKLNDKGFLNRSVVSGLIDGFVPQM